jgi:hypothetical protein
VATKRLRVNNIPIYCSTQDEDYLSAKGLIVKVLDEAISNPFLAGTIRLVPCTHGKGIIGSMMAHVLVIFTATWRTQLVPVWRHHTHQIGRKIYPQYATRDHCSGQVQPDTFLKEFSNSIGDWSALAECSRSTL